MKVNATEFRTNLKDYIAKSATEDVIITNRGHEVARLISSKRNKLDILDSLVGVIPTMSDEEHIQIKEERLSKI